MTFRVVSPGFPGTYFDQPEPAELVATCPVTGKDADMVTDDLYASPGDMLSVWCFACDAEHVLEFTD